MAIAEFPPVDSADESGLLAIGGDMEVESLILAYTNGIFPWPIQEDYPLTWFSPDPRGVITIENFKVSKSLKRFLNQSPYEIKVNSNFNRVIEECAKIPRKGQSSTWIFPEIIASYCELFKQKFAYSVEAYLDNELVGGVYGVCIGELVTGESMFHKSDNASKACLVYLLNILKEKGIPFLDTQMVTPVVKSLGGEEIPRDLFLNFIQSLDLQKSRDWLFH